ncbi:alpha/beta fold hydrolase [Achromobacter insuavis]|uniref:alpha/beta fold hydrolase n=1 Tax=Achromobacter insuavis TaxID=1287735 RepID=UPI000E3024A3|nr:alpha/beta hydrolase [Achromobacter insuavis]
MTSRLPDHEVAGHGPFTIYLLHGAYGSRQYFRDLIAALVAHGYRVVAWDAPGYGLSELPTPYSIDMAASACANLVATTGTRTNVLVGHSMGGIIAPLTAVKLGPERVQGLVVSATVGSFSSKSKEDQRIFLEERIAPLAQGRTLSAAAEPLLRTMLAPGSSGPMVDRVLRMAMATRTETFVAAINAIVDYEGAPALARVAVPTLAIAGELDTVGRPAQMQALANAISGAEFVSVPAAAHYAWAEQPEAFNRALLDFLSRRVGAVK